MTYDSIVIGAGLGGLISALIMSQKGKKVIVISKGLGNLYSSSGYIDLMGYYPVNSSVPLLSPMEAIEKLVKEEKNHPYSLVGPKLIEEAFTFFLETSKKAGIPYKGSPDKNILKPTAAGSLVPTTLFPENSQKDLTQYNEIVVVGIKELIDFFPAFTAGNLEAYLKKKIKFEWVNLGIKSNRELNSYDMGLYMEQKDIRKHIINQLKPVIKKGSLILIPAVLGVNNYKEVQSELEENLEASVIEIPTLPPSLAGYRLAESLMKYLKGKGTEMIIGSPVTVVNIKDRRCEGINITSANGREKKFIGKNYILATGGILGEGLQVYPKEIKEEVFNLPVIKPGQSQERDFFTLQSNSLSCAGVKVNEKLQPLNRDGHVILENVYVAGATLEGYDPFLEKSGNGVALATGYKAGLMAADNGERLI